jgi:U3 small nucleolar RNA-associated protein 21
LTGEYLATIHVCNLGICLWSNRTLYSHVSLKAINSEENIPLISLPGSTADTIVEIQDNELIEIEEDNEDDQEYVSPDQLSSKLITMSALAISRWQNLLNIDVIKRKNKPKEAPKAPASAPFFLPTIAALQPQFDFSDVKTVKDDSKLLAHPDFQNLTPFGRILHKTIGTDDYTEVIESLKNMGPNAIDLEVQSLAFDVKCSVTMLLQFMKMLRFMLKNKKNFELAQAYLSLFLKSHGNIITEEKELSDYLEKFEKVQLKSWSILREKLFYNLSVVQHLKRTY